MSSADGAGGVGRVLVTGGSSGLGLAIARAVEREGGRPLVLDLAPPPFAVDHELVDLADTRSAEAATGRLAERAGGLDGLVTAAGIDRPGRLADLAATDWERIVAVNLLGTAAAGSAPRGRRRTPCACRPGRAASPPRSRPAPQRARA